MRRSSAVLALKHWLQRAGWTLVVESGYWLCLLPSRSSRDPTQLGWLRLKNTSLLRENWRWCGSFFHSHIQPPRVFEVESIFQLGVSSRRAPEIAAPIPPTFA